MREPLSDNITLGEREPGAERHPGVPVEREVRLDGVRLPEDVIRARVKGGFYHTPAVAAVVARRIVGRGDI
jgi:hypothetical protein